MGTITLIRHGQASFGKANYDELSALGVRQGQALGRWFNQCERKFDRIVTGSLKRHRQTAQACCETLAPRWQPEQDWEINPAFDEYDHMQMLLAYEPRFTQADFLRALFQDHPNPQREFQRLFTAAFARWMSGEHPEDYRESWPDFRQRCLSGLNQLIDQAQTSQQVAVFTSGGPITAICQHLLGLPDTQVAELNSRFANASLTRIFHQPGRISLSTMNSFAHFEQLPQDQLITYR